MTTAEREIIYWLNQWIANGMTTTIIDNLIHAWRRSAESDQDDEE